MELLSSEEDYGAARTWWVLLAIIGVAAGILLAGVRKDLPYSHEIDENIYVERAIQMAASGDLNPRWFGNPGSTVLYPLVALFHTWHAIEHGGSFLCVDKNIGSVFLSEESQFYLLGRLLTVCYALLAVLMTFLVGKRLFGERVALIGAAFSILSPLVLHYGQVVRTDLAGSFYGMLSLWLLLRLYDEPSTKNQLLAGLSIGFAFGTRYFMITLVPILVAVDILLLCRRRRNAERQPTSWPTIALGLLAVLLGFAICTPFFVLDLSTALQSLVYEARPRHFGQDGLSPMGNLTWYLTRAIPNGISLPLAVLAAIGALLILIRHRTRQLLALGFVVVFVASTSLSRLHWSRWMIQVFPILSLLAAEALCEASSWLSRLLQFRPKHRHCLLAALVLLASALPLHDVLLYLISDTATNTRILAREWIIRNLPPGAKVAYETYSANLDSADLLVFGPTMLTARGSLLDYYRAGYRYLVVTNSIYERFFARSERYPREVAFYQDLFSKGHLLKELTPSPLRGGPTIRIYRLGGPLPAVQQNRQSEGDMRQ